MRAIFRDAFTRAGLPYSNPHPFRKTLVALGKEKCRTWEEMQAWAQNLGHESLTTTFANYGKVSSDDQGKLVRNAGTANTSEADKLDHLIDLVARIRLEQSNGV
jgi:integrase